MKSLEQHIQELMDIHKPKPPLTSLYRLAIHGLQPYGKYIAVALKGTEEQIRETSDAMYNAGMCGELQETAPQFAFVWVKPENLLRGLTAIIENQLWARNTVTPEESLHQYAKAMAQRQIDAMPKICFLRRGEVDPETDREALAAVQEQSRIFANSRD